MIIRTDPKTGKKTKIGRTKEAKAQKKFDTNMRKFTNKEFFDEDNLSRINVKYVIWIIVLIILIIVLIILIIVFLFWL